MFLLLSGLAADTALAFEWRSFNAVMQKWFSCIVRCVSVRGAAVQFINY